MNNFFVHPQHAYCSLYVFSLFPNAWVRWAGVSVLLPDCLLPKSISHYIRALHPFNKSNRGLFFFGVFGFTV